MNHHLILGSAVAVLLLSLWFPAQDVGNIARLVIVGYIALLVQTNYGEALLNWWNKLVGGTDEPSESASSSEQGDDSTSA